MTVVLEGPVVCDRTVVLGTPVFCDCSPRKDCVL